MDSGFRELESSENTSRVRSAESTLPSRGSVIGLAAAWGQYPVTIARALKRQGYRVCCVALKDLADPILKEICDDHREVGLARMGAAIRFFRRCGVTHATMAGKIHKKVIFERFSWIRHTPDWRFIRTFFPHWALRTKDRRDDTLVAAIVAEFAKDGIVFAPATQFAPELLVSEGVLAGRCPSAAIGRDIAFGWQIAKQLGGLDVGQSVAVKGQAVIAVEAIEGTDECIRRAGELCPSGGFTVVKVAKPQQDMRWDVPTIGIGTIESLAAAGGKTLAIEAGMTIVVEEDAVRRLAQRLGITVVALRQPPALCETAEAA